MVITLGKGKNIYLLHKVSALDIALSIRHLSIMLKSGMALSDSVKVLAEHTPDLKLKDAYVKIHGAIQAGTSLGEAMKKHKDIFSDIVVSVITVGEQGGSLETNLNFLTDYLKKDYELQRKVKGALVYPMIVFFLSIIEMGGVVFFILPKLESLFASFENTPAFTAFVLKSVSFIRAHVVEFGVGLLVIFVLYSIISRTRFGREAKHRIGLMVPVFSKINTSNSIATLSRTIGILLGSGIPLATALEISVNSTPNTVYKKAIIDIQKKVSGGKNLASAMMDHKRLFPPTYVKMIEIGEQSGALETNLLYLYDFYAEEVEDMSNNLTTLLEPILMIFVGAMIGVLALTIVGPIYQLTGSISGAR